MVSGRKDDGNGHKVMREQLICVCGVVRVYV